MEMLLAKGYRRFRSTRFGASGGADSSDTEQVTTSFALVRTTPMPPLAGSRHHVSSNARATQWRKTTEND